MSVRAERTQGLACTDIVGSGTIRMGGSEQEEGGLGNLEHKSWCSYPGAGCQDTVLKWRGEGSGRVSTPRG